MDVESLPKLAAESEFGSLSRKITPNQAEELEPEMVKCDCCGLTEECTIGYIEMVKERYFGRWVCGLCAEAVKDEIRRAGGRISIEEAINRHTMFFKKFQSVSSPVNAAEHWVAAVKKIMMKCLDSPRPDCRKVVPQNHEGST